MPFLLLPYCSYYTWDAEGRVKIHLLHFQTRLAIIFTYDRYFQTNVFPVTVRTLTNVKPICASTFLNLPLRHLPKPRVLLPSLKASRRNLSCTNASSQRIRII